ncbi:hypothetical protein Tco_0443371 [Tanacetum coccineum]
MNEGVWTTDPVQIKDAFVNFFKDKFQARDSQVVFPTLSHSTGLSSHDHDALEMHVSLDEIKNTFIWSNWYG